MPYEHDNPVRNKFVELTAKYGNSFGAFKTYDNYIDAENSFGYRAWDLTHVSEADRQSLFQVMKESGLQFQTPPDQHSVFIEQQDFYTWRARLDEQSLRATGLPDTSSRRGIKDYIYQSEVAKNTKIQGTNLFVSEYQEHQIWHKAGVPNIPHSEMDKILTNTKSEHYQHLADIVIGQTEIVNTPNGEVFVSKQTFPADNVEHVIRHLNNNTLGTLNIIKGYKDGNGNWHLAIPSNALDMARESTVYSMREGSKSIPDVRPSSAMEGELLSAVRSADQRNSKKLDQIRANSSKLAPPPLPPEVKRSDFGIFGGIIGGGEAYQDAVAEREEKVRRREKYFEQPIGIVEQDGSTQTVKNIGDFKPSYTAPANAPDAVKSIVADVPPDAPKKSTLPPPPQKKPAPTQQVVVEEAPAPVRKISTLPPPPPKTQAQPQQSSSTAPSSILPPPPPLRNQPTAQPDAPEEKTPAPKRQKLPPPPGRRAHGYDGSVTFDDETSVELRNRAGETVSEVRERLRAEQRQSLAAASPDITATVKTTTSDTVDSTPKPHSSVTPSIDIPTSHRTSAGGNAAGAVMDAKDFVKAAVSGDKDQMISSGGSLSVNAIAATDDVLAAGGSSSGVVSKIAGPAGFAIMAINTGKKLAVLEAEQGINYKSEQAALVRDVAVGVTAGIVGGAEARAAASYLGVTGVALGVTGVVSGAAIGAAAVGAVVGTNYLLDRASGGAIYDTEEKRFAANIDSKGQMTGLTGKFHAQLANAETGKIDWKDTATLNKYEILLNREIEMQKQAVIDNSTRLAPRWFRGAIGSESLGREYDARRDLKIAESAQTELKALRTEQMSMAKIEALDRDGNGLDIADFDRAGAKDKAGKPTGDGKLDRADMDSIRAALGNDKLADTFIANLKNNGVQFSGEAVPTAQQTPASIQLAQISH